MRKKGLLLYGFLILQLLGFWIIDQNMDVKSSYFSTLSDNKQYQIRIQRNEKTEQAEMLYITNGEVIRRREVKANNDSEFQKLWYTSSLVYISIKTNNHVQSYIIDFTNPMKDYSDNELSDIIKNKLILDAEKDKEITELPAIDTETGYSLEHDKVEVTYDYGKTWKKTPISSRLMTFPSGTQLRLSDESMQIASEFSYFYVVDSQGWLNYFTSSDAGENWNQIQTQIAAFNVSYFKSGILSGNPYIIMMDKNVEILAYYISEDNGIYFKEKYLAVSKSGKAPIDTSIMEDKVMYLTYLDSKQIYRSSDEGTTFDEINIGDTANINYFLAPKEVNGQLQMIGIDAKNNHILYVTADHGLTWNKAEGV